MKRERGFALIAVLLVLALLAVLGAEFAYSMRLEASAMRAWRDGLAAAHLAEAGVEQAIREIAGDYAYVGTDADGVLTFYSRDRLALTRLPRTNVPFGAGEFSYRITDEQSRIGLNTASNLRLDKLLQCLGLDKAARDHVVDAILDWIDPNEEHRGNGAESDDYYLKLPVPYRAHNGPIESLGELLQIKGITQALFDGVDGRPGLADVLTVRGLGPVNVNTVGPVVMCGMGVADAVSQQILEARRVAGLFTAVPSYIGVPGFAANTVTFRIEAEGLIGGKPRASIVAIVQKLAVTGTAPIKVLEWSGVR